MDPYLYAFLFGNLKQEILIKVPQDQIWQEHAAQLEFANSFLKLLQSM